MLNEMIEIKKRFEEVKKNSGLIAIDEDEIHLQTKYFFEKFSIKYIKFREMISDNRKLVAECWYNGALFFTLVAVSDLEDYVPGADVEWKKNS